MSKLMAYTVLQELGGKDIPNRPVSTTEIRNYVKKQRIEHNHQLHLHAGLGRLRHWKYVTWNNKDKTYTIIEKLEEPNIHNSPITEEDIYPNDD